MTRYRSKKPIAEINVVPYIDVMLVLLIIFMVTAPLLTEGVQVDLPKGSGKTVESENDYPIVLTIDKLGRYYLNISAHSAEPMALSAAQLEVAAALRINKNRQIVVKGDAMVDYGKVVEAMASLQVVGAEKIGLVTAGIRTS